MILYKTIIFGNGQKVEFGIPNTDIEIKKMFDLRFKVYVKEKKYVTDSDDPMADADKHDKNGKSIYFIASINNEVVGTARIIRENITPMEADYFNFEKPKVLNELPREKIVEIGRIISRPYQITGIKVPRSLVMLGIVSTMTEFGEKQGVVGGYGAMKMSAFRKFVKLNVPVHKIKNARLKFDKIKTDDPLSNFFNNDDPVVPLYFLMKEISTYTDTIFNHSRLFRKIGTNLYEFQSSGLGFLNRLILFFTLKLKNKFP